METVREKLAKLISENGFATWFADAMADMLIQNGVTFATDTNVADKWVSVKKPPKENGIYQVFIYDNDWHRWKVWYGQFVLPYSWFVYDIQGDYIPCTVTHWMPMPQPPKEVQ